jgi:hypothetical protein
VPCSSAHSRSACMSFPTLTSARGVAAVVIVTKCLPFARVAVTHYGNVFGAAGPKRTAFRRRVLFVLIFLQNTHNDGRVFHRRWRPRDRRCREGTDTAGIEVHTHTSR